MTRSELRDPEWLHEQYVVQQRSIAEIASDLEVNPQTVSNWLKKSGIAVIYDRGRRIFPARNCATCGIEFTPTGPSAKYCTDCARDRLGLAQSRYLERSRKNRQAARRQDRKCLSCGTTFRGLQSENFCSQVSCQEVAKEAKRCWQCKRVLVKSYFTHDASRNDGLDARCRDCRLAQQRAVRESQPEPTRQRFRDYMNRFRWNSLGLDKTYDEMLAAQGGVCAICGNPPKEGFYLALDHDHSCCSTGQACNNCIRELLCRPHNLLLGNADDDPVVLLAGILYLQRHGKRKIIDPVTKRVDLDDPAFWARWQS